MTLVELQEPVCYNVVHVRAHKPVTTSLAVLSEITPFAKFKWTDIHVHTCNSIRGSDCAFAFWLALCSRSIYGIIGKFTAMIILHFLACSMLIVCFLVNSVVAH